MWRSNASDRGLRLQSAARRVSSTVVELSGPTHDGDVGDNVDKVRENQELRSESDDCLDLHTYCT